MSYPGNALEEYHRGMVTDDVWRDWAKRIVQSFDAELGAVKRDHEKIATLEAKLAQAEREVERFQGAASEFLEILDNGNKAYPTDVFPEPPKGEHGKTIDACSARMGRHVYSMLMREWKRTIGAALAEESE